MGSSSIADQGLSRLSQPPNSEAKENAEPPAVSFAVGPGAQTVTVPVMQNPHGSMPGNTLSFVVPNEVLVNGRRLDLSVAGLIGIARGPQVLEQEGLLGSFTTATLKAFTTRLQVLPGVGEVVRQGAETWLRGSTWLGSAGAGVSAALGHLVDTRPRNVIHFDMTALDIDLNAIYCGAQYGMRGLGIATNASDIVVLPEDMPQEGIDAVRRSRRLAGLPNPYIISEGDFRKHRRELEREYGPVEMFMRDAAHVDQKSVAWSKILNNKLDGATICQRLGVPLPQTFHNDVAGKLDYTRIPANTPLILKAEYSAGGSGVKFVANVDDLKERVAALNATDRIQVQRWVPGEDISFLFHCGEHGATLISSSQQEMEGGVSHVGNAIPGDRHRIRDAYATAMKPFADYAQRKGFRGHLGIDARISDVDGEVDFIECNPRRTAVSTPTVIATQLGFPEFCHRQMVFKDKASLDITLDRFAYRPDKKQGVVITTCLGKPGNKYKSEFVFLEYGTDGTKFRDEVIRWAKGMGYLYDAK